jgi:hypothetical protein
MTIRRWITLASAAAMIAGVGACKDNTGGSAVGTKTGSEAQGRRGDTLPRARADAGADLSGSAAGSTTTSPSQDTAGSASGTSSDTTKK